MTGLNFLFRDSLLVASVNNFAIVDYQPDKAGTDGYSDLGFRKVYTPGLSTINRYNVDGSFDDIFISAGLGDANITVASGLTLGPDGLVYINDQGANSVKKYDVSGNFQGYFLNGTTPDTPEEVVIGQDGTNDYSLYVSSLTGDGVKRYDFETGTLLDHIAFIPGTSTPLSAALMEFDRDGNLYIGGVFSTNQVIKYNPDTKLAETFIASDIAQLIPSGIAFDKVGNLYNGTFSGPTFGLPPTTIAQYSPTGQRLDVNFVDNSSNELDISSRVRLFDLNDDGATEFYVSNFGGSSIMKYLGPDTNTPGASEGAYISDSISGGSLSNPGGLISIPGEAGTKINFTPVQSDGNLGSLTYKIGNTSTVSLDQQVPNLTNALFDNLIGFYRLANAQGAVIDINDANGNGSIEDLLNPGDIGYASSALGQYKTDVLLRLGAEGDTNKNTSAAQFGDVLINGGEYYAPFVIANGGNLLEPGDTLAEGIAKFLDINSQNTAATVDNFWNHEVAYFSFGVANPDGVEHLRSYGNNVFGFEDLPGNLGVSDFDFNDAVFQIIFA